MQDFFTSKNFAIVIMTLAIIFLVIMLVQACTKNKSGRDSEDSEGYMSHDSLSYEYYYDEEDCYTNS